MDRCDDWRSWDALRDGEYLHCIFAIVFYSDAQMVIANRAKWEMLSSGESRMRCEDFGR